MKGILCSLFFCLSFLMCSPEKPASSSIQTVSLTSDDKDKLLAKIKALEEELKEKSKKSLHLPTAQQLLALSKQFVEAFPKAPQTPAILFRTADLARGMGEYGQAIKYWGLLYNDYSDFEKAPDAEFMIAFTYENFLNDKQQAKGYYERFLQKYPDHHLAEQVKAILENIDKSPEELIKSFQEKRQEKK
ncbi:MAG: tetratricopeptide repeat protein [Bacteroidota bacterium]